MGWRSLIKADDMKCGEEKTRIWLGIVATSFVLALVVWALFHLSATLDNERASYRWLVDPICMGFFAAIPVIWVRRYSIRALSSTALSLAFYLLLIVALNPHPGFPKRVDLAVLVMFGGVCAAHVRSGWEVARNHLRDVTARNAKGDNV